MPQWIDLKTSTFDLNIVNNVNGIRKLIPVSSYIERFYTTSFQRDLLNNGKMAYLIDNKVENGTAAYSANELLNDIRNNLFSETTTGKTPDFYLQMLQSIYVDRLINMSKFGKPAGGKQAVALNRIGIPYAQSAPCIPFGNEKLLPFAEVHSENNIYFQYIDFRASDKLFKVESLVLGELKDIRALIIKGIKIKNPVPDHYDFLLRRIDTFLSTK